MSINADFVAAVAIYGVAGISLAYGVALMSVQAQVNSISKYRLGTADALPNLGWAGARLSAIVTAWWVWTAAHKAVGDGRLSRAVVLGRVLCIATILVWAALWLAPRDVAERIAAWAAANT